MTQNKKNKIPFWQKIFLLIISFWAILLIRNALNTNIQGNFASLWIQFFYITWYIFVLIFLVFLFWGLGKKISKVCLIPYKNLCEEFSFATSLGLGAFSLIMLIIGAVKLFYPAAVYIITLIIFIATIKELKEIIREISGHWGKYAEFKPDIQQILLLSLLGLTILILFTGTFTPPISYDALAYHLGVPKIYIKEHGIVSLPYHVYSNFPFNIEMLYTYSVLLTNSEILAKMFHFLTAILTGFAIYSFGNRYLDRRIGFLAAVIFLNIPLVGQLSVLCYNDLGLTLFIFLSIFAFINWVYSPEKEKLRWLVLCGILTGLALGTKYFAVTFLVGFLAIAILIKSLSSTNPGRKSAYTAKNLIIFFCLSLGVFFPWMLKNLIITGNPVFPFLYPILKGGNWNIQHYHRFVNVHLANIFTLKEFFLQLWQLLSNPLFGMPFAFILPIIFLKRKIPARPPASGGQAAGGNAQIKILLIYAIYYYFVWFFLTHRVDRFIIPLYAFLCILVAYTVFNLPKALKILTGIVLSIFIVFNLLILVVVSENTGFTETFSGMKNKEEYLEEKLYYYPAIKYINEELPIESKILFIGDNQTYYCEKPLLSNSPLDRSVIVEVVGDSKNSEDVNNNLKAMGISHIYYNASEAKRIQETYHAFDWRDEEEYTKFLNFLENYTKKLFEKNGCFIFEIK